MRHFGSGGVSLVPLDLIRTSSDVVRKVFNGKRKSEKSPGEEKEWTERIKRDFTNQVVFGALQAFHSNPMPDSVRPEHLAKNYLISLNDFWPRRRTRDWYHSFIHTILWAYCWQWGRERGVTRLDWEERTKESNYALESLSSFSLHLVVPHFRIYRVWVCLPWWPSAAGDLRQLRSNCLCLDSPTCNYIILGSNGERGDELIFSLLSQIMLNQDVGQEE